MDSDSSDDEFFNDIDMFLDAANAVDRLPRQFRTRINNESENRNEKMFSRLEVIEISL